MFVFIRLFLGSLLLACSLNATAAQPLLEVNETVNLLTAADSTLIPIDIRSPEAYAAGHLPGAISAPYSRWRGPANNPGQLLSSDAFAELIQELGLSPEQHLLVYATGEDETDFGAAARVYWTLKYLGFDQLSVLNGGYRYWQQEQQTQIDTAANRLPASQTGIQLRPQLAIATDELLDKITREQNNYLLLDSRPPAFFQGSMKAPTASVGGTIAGARNLPFQQWFIEGETRVRPAEEIRQLVAQQQLEADKELLSFCNTGHWAATNWFVLSELAGLDSVRLYPASMAEWTQHTHALPMDNTPSRWEQIVAKLQHLVD